MKYKLLGILNFLLIPSLLFALDYFAFDWDDNVFYMPTQMIILNSETNSIEMLPTNVYGLIRTQSGQKGMPYGKYQFTENSFKYAHDDPTGKENYFLNDIIKATNQDNSQWQGPDWHTFAEKLSDSDMASRVIIITAREQTPSSILAGLQYLQQKGLLKYLPLVENIWSVNHPQFKEIVKERWGVEVPADDLKGDPQRKFYIMKHYLDLLTTKRATHSPFMEKRLYDQEINLWYFSDDNQQNIEKTKQNVKDYPVRSTVQFTGLNTSHK